MSEQPRFTKEMEREADRLAFEILLPTVLVEEYATQHQVNRQEVVSMGFIRLLARIFCVSDQTAAVRLHDLGYNVALAHVL